jgi:thymidylate kinase
MSPRTRVGRGRLVTFSGLDGCGKSTQISLLQQSVAARGEHVHVVWSRGGYTAGVLILKSLLRRVLGRRAPGAGPSEARSRTLGRPTVARAWLAIAMLDLIRLYGVELRGRRALGQTVICDRYLWDTLADFEVNFPRQDVASQWLWKLLVRVAVTPDAAFYLDIDPALSDQRAVEKNDPFPEPIEARVRRAHCYQRLVTPSRFVVIPATWSREAIARRVADSLAPHGADS